MMDGRNSKNKSFLKYKGGSLLRILLDNYPGKASEVFKYLKLAGYEEGEMMEFIDREMGKNKDTEFLYQSSLGRKFLKEKKQRNNSCQSAEACHFLACKGILSFLRFLLSCQITFHPSYKKA